MVLQMKLNELIDFELFNSIETIFKAKKYVLTLFPWMLNVIGIRTSDMKMVNIFNDYIVLIWKDEIKVNTRIFPATTKPGLNLLKKPINKKGTAILVPEQYLNAYKKDLHNGKYQALCQRHFNVNVFRDSNKDSAFDLNPETIESGFFGINIHRASAFQKLPFVGANSAGCQVFQNPDDFNFMMNLVDKHIVRYKNSFTYTLLEEKDFEGV